MLEEWRIIDDKYEVSNLGRVRNLSTKRIKCLRKNTNGYILVDFWVNGKKSTPTVHRLVARAFIKNDYNKKDVNHIDNNRSNNVLSNLEWVTRKENIQHCILSKRFKSNFPLGEKHHSSKLSQKDVLEIRNSNLPIKDLCKKYKVGQTNISKILLRQTWKNI